MLLSVDRGLLEGFQFVLTHDGLSNIDSQEVASVADVAEAEVQVAAAEANPVTDALGQACLLACIRCLLYVLIHLINRVFLIIGINSFGGNLILLL